MFPAAKVGDQVMGGCLHTYQSTTPSPVGPVPTPVPTPLPFVGQIVSFEPTCLIGGVPAVTTPANVVNTAVHPPAGGASIPGPAVPPATNTAIVVEGSPTVLINNKPLVRMTSKTAMPACGLLAPAVTIGTAVNMLVP
jgi:uncharacterized Zn-binding protein involved in type VI secretion